MAAAIALAGPTAALAQGGSRWIDPPEQIVRPVPAPATPETTKPPTPTSVEKPPRRLERRVERRPKPVAATRSGPRPRPARVARSQSQSHVFARLFGPGRRGAFIINTTNPRN
jgi:hypothetical protein